MDHFNLYNLINYPLNNYYNLKLYRILLFYLFSIYVNSN